MHWDQHESGRPQRDWAQTMTAQRRNVNNPCVEGRTHLARFLSTWMRIGDDTSSTAQPTGKRYGAHKHTHVQSLLNGALGFSKLHYIRLYFLGGGHCARGSRTSQRVIIHNCQPQRVQTHPHGPATRGRVCCTHPGAENATALDKRKPERLPTTGRNSPMIHSRQTTQAAQNHTGDLPKRSQHLSPSHAPGLRHNTTLSRFLRRGSGPSKTQTCSCSTALRCMGPCVCAPSVDTFVLDTKQKQTRPQTERAVRHACTKAAAHKRPPTCKHHCKEERCAK